MPHWKASHHHCRQRDVTKQEKWASFNLQALEKVSVQFGTISCTPLGLTWISYSSLRLCCLSFSLHFLTKFSHGISLAEAKSVEFFERLNSSPFFLFLWIVLSLVLLTSISTAFPPLFIPPKVLRSTQFWNCLKIASLAWNLRLHENE